MPEKHSRVVGGKRHVWYTKRLWQTAANLEPFDLPVSAVQELDADCWFGEAHAPTLRAVADHCRRIQSTHMEFPIILAADGSLMDGGHRVCRALLDGRPSLRAVRFSRTPPPDEIHEVAV